MPLSGDQARKLHAAILSGFSGPDLEQVLRFDLNERLDNITGSGPLSAVVMNLITWAEQNGKTDDLVRAVQRARPNNNEIQAAAKSILSPTPSAVPKPGATKLDGTQRSRMRSALIDQFPTRPDLAMLVDEALSVNLDGITRDSNLNETVFELIKWASIDPEGQLKPLLSLAVEQRPNSDELKALLAELFGG
jgi:hypothetical protein